MGFGPGFGRGGPGAGFGRGGGAFGRGGPGAPGRGVQGKPSAGPRPSGVQLDPLIGLDDARQPLRSRLLAVPHLRKRYLEHVRTIAADWLDWRKLKPIVDQYRALIEKEVELDTRKLTSFAAFRRSLGDAGSAGAAPQGGRPTLSLEAFAVQRRKYLLDYPEIKNALP
jgi:hypothetical protein